MNTGTGGTAEFADSHNRLSEQQKMGTKSGRARVAHSARSQLALLCDVSKTKWLVSRCRIVLLLVFGFTFSIHETGASQFARLDYNVYIGSLYRHTIFLELYDDRPITTTNFLQYVNAGKYDGSMIHRLVTGFVMQGGGYYPQFVSEPQIPSLPYSFNPNLVVDLDGNSATPNPTIANEFANAPARLNARGTISMAQPPGAPNGASSQWFINLADNTGLDVANSGSGPYTAFGKVSGDGMDYVTSLLSSVTVRDMNPDSNDDGTRDANGPFGTAPLYVGGGSLYPLQLVNVDQIDYYGAGTSTVVDGSWSISTRNAVIDTGATFTGTSGLVVESNRSLQTRDGYSLGVDLVNYGTVEPGLQIGKLTVGNYYQFPNSTLNIEIAGPTADTQYDRLVAAGQSGAFLAGKLDVTFLGGYSPALNTTFTVVSANSITGAFATFDLPQLAAGLVWRIARTSTAYTLTVAGGDYNQNGVVDAADYIIWRVTRGMTVTAGSGADGNGNGIVDDQDYAVWRANLGNVRGTSSGTGSGSLGPNGVPEPNVGLLFLSSVLTVMLNRRTRSC